LSRTSSRSHHQTKSRGRTKNELVSFVVNNRKETIAKPCKSVTEDKVTAITRNGIITSRKARLSESQCQKEIKRGMTSHYTTVITLSLSDKKTSCWQRRYQTKGVLQTIESMAIKSRNQKGFTNLVEKYSISIHRIKRIFIRLHSPYRINQRLNNQTTISESPFSSPSSSVFLPFCFDQ
jgi:hypothetical protein